MMYFRDNSRHQNQVFIIPVGLQVQAGKLSPQDLYQASAMYERFRHEYRKTLARLVENVR